MITVHLKKLKRRFEISSEEERVIRDLIAEIRRVPADEVIVHAGEELNVSLLLIDGWLARIKDLAGGERQVTQLHVPGDFADLHGFALKRLDHDVATMSDCRIAVAPQTANAELMRRSLPWHLTNRTFVLTGRTTVQTLNAIDRTIVVCEQCQQSKTREPMLTHIVASYLRQRRCKMGFGSVFRDRAFG